MTLAETKSKILNNASALEQEGFCSKADGYQALLNAVAQDIRNQRHHRKRRKAEIKKLSYAFQELEHKKIFYEEQAEQWDQYVRNTVANMGQGAAPKYSSC